MGEVNRRVVVVAGRVVWEWNRRQSRSVCVRAGKGFFGGGDVGIAGGDKNSHDHLLTAQQRVADELARAQSDGGVGVGHGCCLA